MAKKSTTKRSTSSAKSTRRVAKGKIKQAISTTSSSTERYHVIFQKNGWAVKREGKAKAAKVHNSKSTAITHARSLALKVSGTTDVIVHRSDGTIEKWVKGKRASKKK